MTAQRGELATEPTEMFLVLQAWPERTEGWAVQDVCRSPEDAQERIEYLLTRDWLEPDHRYEVVPVTFPPNPGPKPKEIP